MTPIFAAHMSQSDDCVVTIGFVVAVVVARVVVFVVVLLVVLAGVGDFVVPIGGAAVTVGVPGGVDEPAVILSTVIANRLHILWSMPHATLLHRPPLRPVTVSWHNGVGLLRQLSRQPASEPPGPHAPVQL